MCTSMAAKKRKKKRKKMMDADVHLHGLLVLQALPDAVAHAVVAMGPYGGLHGLAYQVKSTQGGSNSPLHTYVNHGTTGSQRGDATGWALWSSPTEMGQQAW